mmetsp:Transcript_34917/g.103700  ORF Transcript_34917/g.103700 Transcript_34917/m.103700 type:complete len:305 (-) Transcript_34917:764-1678(-)
MALATASSPFLASVTACSFSFVSFARSSVALPIWKPTSRSSLSRSATCSTSFAMRISAFSSCVFNSVIASEAFSRFMVALETSPSQKPLWFASSAASFRSLSMSWLIMTLTLARGSEATLETSIFRAPLLSALAFAPRRVATLLLRTRESASLSAEAALPEALLETATALETALRWCGMRRGCAHSRPKCGWTSALCTTWCSCPSASSLPETSSDWMISSACVSALSSFARACVLWSQRTAFSWHDELSCSRYCLSPRSSAEVMERSWLAVAASSCAFALSDLCSSTSLLRFESIVSFVWTSES